MSVVLALDGTPMICGNDLKTAEGTPGEGCCSLQNFCFPLDICQEYALAEPWGGNFAVEIGGGIFGEYFIHLTKPLKWTGSSYQRDLAGDPVQGTMSMTGITWGDGTPFNIYGTAQQAAASGDGIFAWYGSAVTNSIWCLQSACGFSGWHWIHNLHFGVDGTQSSNLGMCPCFFSGCQDEDDPFITCGIEQWVYFGFVGCDKFSVCPVSGLTWVSAQGLFAGPWHFAKPDIVINFLDA